MKVQDLQDAELDYWVARIERGDTETLRNFDFWKREVWDAGSNRFSSSWADGGHIIEREQIAIWPTDLFFGRKLEGQSTEMDNYGAEIRIDGKPGHLAFGPTHLIAAMRSYVYSVYGEDVSHPPEKE